MKKTTAKVEHRDYVPRGWIAIEFCDVDFYGFRAEEMERKWLEIRSRRYDEYNDVFEYNEAKIKSLRSSATTLREQAKKSKPFYRFWYNASEKNLLSTADNLSRQANELEQKNEEIGNNRFFGVYERHRKIEELLQQNGFVLIMTSSKGEECIVETEIWSLEE